jgi:Large ribosomal RNA subunit accumulation protein YceD
VKADVAQACSVSLAPVPEKIDEPFDVLFLPDAKDPNENFEMPEDIHAFLASEDPPEPLINNQIDLYGVIREFIALGLNPFPRKEGAEFTQPQEDNLISPFSALAQLTRKS